MKYSFYNGYKIIINLTATSEQRTVSFRYQYWLITLKNILQILPKLEKLVDLSSAAPRVCVMCQNISDWLTVDCLIVCKVIPIVTSPSA